MIQILRKLPLRTKLAILYAVLLISSVVLLSYYSYWNIWQLLVENETSDLRARAKPIIEHWLVQEGLTQPDSLQQKFQPQSAVPLARDLTSRDAVAIVLNRQGKIIANGKRLQEEPDFPVPVLKYVRQALAGYNEVTYWDKVNGKPVLVLLIPLRPQPGSPYVFGVVQVSTFLSDVNAILFRHASMQISAVTIVLILGILFGYWLIGLNLRDLRTLSSACQEIARGDFARRAEVKNRTDEIGKLAESFNRMIEKLEDTFRSQERFVANAAHELLTPLTGLKGSLEVLMRGAQDDPAAVNRLSRGMYKEVTHLIRVCDQLLGLSRLENAYRIEKQEIVLPEFVQGFVRKAKSLTQNHRIDLQEGPSVTLMADNDLLEQVFFNLLSNAVRYSSPNTPIVLGWKLIPGFVEFRISDAGVGLDAETLSHVFEPFYRKGNPKIVGEKGTGLGLTLAQSIVEAHGGTIQIESTPGKGTTVYFTMPL